MNQLNKLIEQWGESKNSPSAASSFKSMIAYEYENGGSPWLDFINFILASRPTCGIEQRLFLDEIEKGSLYKSDYDSEIQKIYPNWKKIDVGEHTEIWSEDFESDLQKVINGE